MAASASVMLPGSIFSISLRASAVRLAWAIKPTIRWPLSYHERAEVSVSRLNTKKVDRKVALNGAGEVGIIKLVRWRRSLVENGTSETAGVAGRIFTFGVSRWNAAVIHRVTLRC